MLIVQLVQGNINRQKCLSYFFHKITVTAPQKMFANFGAFVAQICLTLFGVRTSFDDYLQENVCRRKPRQLHKLQYSSLLGVFVNSPGKSWSTDLILDALQALTLGIIKRLY